MFLPYLSNLRSRPELAHEEAVLSMDNCRPHVAQEVIHLLPQAPLRVATFAPDTTNIFQRLDFTLFGVFKRRGQYHPLFETENRTADFIFKTCKTFRRTIIDGKIWGAFREMRIYGFRIKQSSGCLFDFGWINKPE
jgi:hypothetical protein